MKSSSPKITIRQLNSVDFSNAANIYRKKFLDKTLKTQYGILMGMDDTLCKRKLHVLYAMFDEGSMSKR